MAVRLAAFEPEGALHSQETCEGSGLNSSALISPSLSSSQLLLVCDKGQEWKRRTDLVGWDS